MKPTTHSCLIFLFIYLYKYVEISTAHHADLWQQAPERVFAAYNPAVSTKAIHHPQEDKELQS